MDATSRPLSQVERHLAQAMANISAGTDTWSKLVDDGFLMCNKMVSLYLSKCNAKADDADEPWTGAAISAWAKSDGQPGTALDDGPDAKPFDDRLTFAITKADQEIADWHAKLGKMIKLLQSQFAKLQDASVLVQVGLLNMPAPVSGLVFDLIKSDTLRDLVTDTVRMYALDLALKLQLMGTLATLGSTSSTLTGMTAPYASVLGQMEEEVPRPVLPAPTTNDIDRAELINLMALWMYQPTVLRRHVAELRDVARLVKGMVGGSGAQGRRS
ncbi:hypothetical protein AMAG_08918 [Allomyces macrogynus ATCC 38327]|uniref:Uncharacterized protein n=1 Tax=Allomyces macrogynus (strain ATCC 38327) TaxID=578462 RepID=A0A0L0SN92_ALLM3|nr:hypothetical protein AMAG_08918 [Allomyces macrogynus ATCC 38327]|eukprot:KNE63854.1 hypothetical protein AMAG_08918 [Allomyces macrogynus ATCC 38327]